jgi:hypothetical protein
MRRLVLFLVCLLIATAFAQDTQLSRQYPPPIPPSQRFPNISLFLPAYAQANQTQANWMGSNFDNIISGKYTWSARYFVPVRELV